MLLTKSSAFIIGPVAQLLGMFMNGIFYVLSKIGLPSIGLSIIIMTIAIYLALLPLTIRQQKFAKLQKKMQPELNKIMKKYEGRKDEASVMRQQEETKAVYKKYGVSATGSCVQLIIQMPILLALYRVFYNVPAYVPMVKEAFFPLVDKLIEVDPSGEFLQTFSVASQFSKQFSNENFTSGVTSYVQNTFIDVLNKFSTADWATLSEHFTSLQGDIADSVSKLTQYNNFLGINMSNSPSYMLSNALSTGAYGMVIVALLIPALAALTQWINTKLMPTADSGSGNDQMASTMKTMNIMMPLMSAVFCYSLPSGMGLYWIAGAVVRSIQQVFVNKHIDKMDIDAMIAKNVEKYEKETGKKMDKEKKVNSSTVNEFSSMNTRNITKRSDKYSTKLSSDQEKKVQDALNSRSGKKFREGSLASKANMVSDYNNVDHNKE